MGKFKEDSIRAEDGHVGWDEDLDFLDEVIEPFEPSEDDFRSMQVENAVRMIEEIEEFIDEKRNKIKYYNETATLKDLEEIEKSLKSLKMVIE